MHAPHALQGFWDGLTKVAVIRQTSQGYIVESESGRNLSKPNLTKAQAERRLKQVEYFKHLDKGRKKT